MNLNNLLFKLLLLTLLYLALVLGSCSNVKHLPQGKSLYTATSIHIDPTAQITDKYTVKKDLYALSRPKPNKKMMGVLRFKLSVYTQTKNKKKGFGKWLNEKIGEPPVLLDTALLERTKRNMQQYMFNHGYFNNAVSFTTEEKNRRSQVTYNVTAISPYKVKNIYYPSDTIDTINSLVRNMQPQALIKPGHEFNVDKLQAEINRIAYELHCKGYYDLISKDLFFELDSTQGTRTIDVYLKVKPPATGGKHKSYTINNVYVFPDYEVGKPPAAYTDTLQVNNFHYIASNKNRFNPNTITGVLLLKKGDLYSQKNWEYSLNHLLGLGVFKFVNVKFEKADTSANNPMLDCRILLTPARRMGISGEVELNNRAQQSVLGAATSSLLGTAATLSYKNKNLLGGAEAFSFTLFTGLELNPQNRKSAITDNALINTLNLSGELQLAVPKFIVPFKLQNQSRYFLPKTNIRLSASYLRRINFYTLNSFNINFGYDWNENSRKRHLFNPVSASLLSLRNKEAAFEEQLAQNSFLRRSFEEQIIAGSNYTYIYNTQNISQAVNFIYFKAGFDLAGNTLYAADRLLKVSGAINKDKQVKILGSSYAQYARAEFDIRHYNLLSRGNSLVSRFNVAVGVPYGNSAVLPYVKQYFVGGPNSVRAFRIRSIGPGSFGAYAVPDTIVIDEFDRTGDIKIEANLEWRFPIVSMLKGALFTDLGNIWTLRSETSGTDPDTGEPIVTRPGGRFGFGTFWSQIAIGTGAGIRLDFSYFVMRFDLGVPIHNPSLSNSEQWPVKNMFEKKWLRSNTNLNLAIGYPF
ncbi:hypothetical protein C7N43_01770 [Sphingobacteriales bacterium UPWRP_1]|nr:hypothetical protein B6N25_15115 [Sphingobacteriales bacterium TSM_CSS]PSJ78754.1 hypothetical protein C7N43_01770 [Sphingobacteriales bacterium UPWRP_1]